MDYSNSKVSIGAMYPVDAIEVTSEDWEPLISPEKLIKLHLWGIPLQSRTINPKTGQRDLMTPEDLKEHIKEAKALAELESEIRITDAEIKERHPYDRNLMDSWGHFVTRHRPVRSVESMSIMSSDGVNIWEIPAAWIDSGYFTQGQINMMPFAVSALTGTQVPVTASMGTGLIPTVFQFHWVPGIWQVTYRIGFADSKIPRIVNQYVGVIAAMEVLGILAQTNANNNGMSLSIDGLGQNISYPGAEIYVQRLTELSQKRQWLRNKLRHQYGLGIKVGNI